MSKNSNLQTVVNSLLKYRGKISCLFEGYRRPIVSDVIDCVQFKETIIMETSIYGSNGAHIFIKVRVDSSSKNGYICQNHNINENILKKVVLLDWK